MPSLPGLLVQPNSCSTQNPLQTLSKTIHPKSNYSDRFQSSSSSAAHQKPNNQFINRQINQEQHHQAQLINQQQQQFNQSPLGGLCHDLNDLQLQPHQPQHDWSTTFLKSVPIETLLHLNNSTLPRSHNPNQWQTEFVGSLQPSQDRNPINDFQHHHPVIQRHPAIPLTVSHPGFPAQFNLRNPIQSHPIQSGANSTDWDSAFLKYDLNNNTSDKLAGCEALQNEHDHHQEVEYIVGSHSPTRSASPDALARTAASLIATVENNQSAINQQSGASERTGVDPAQSVSEKLNQSDFMNFMRKLRDGELKVEGDRLVQQPASGPIESFTTGPTIDHRQAHLTPNNIHQQHSPGGLLARNYRQSRTSTGVVGAQDHLASYRDELEHQMREMNELMEETDEELERTRYREMMNGFQGDGGRVSSPSVDLDGILNAASLVDRPLENHSWTTTTQVPGASELWTEEFDKQSLQEEDEEFFDVMDMFGRPILPQEVELERLKRAQRVPSAQELEWARFQSDWDAVDERSQAFDHASGQTATSSSVDIAERIKALRAETGYHFQQVNPHFLGQDSRTRHHFAHQQWDESPNVASLYPQCGAVFESVLQKEKEVLDQPESATAWYELGVKQQENEHEELAIQALQQAIKLDPQLSDAILALAISYANENQRDKAFGMIEEWIDVEASKVPNYQQHLQNNHQESMSRSPEGRESEDNNENNLRLKHEQLTQKLIGLARLGGRVRDSASVDPYVQIALGVLFNSNDEFQKACDCFASALAVRPLDPLLFNRLGATLANSGKPEEAIEYYNRAIELLPSYIRARYNLSISLINLGKYFESLENLVHALRIQKDQDELKSHGADSAAGLGSNTRPDTSSDVLWQTLEINCSLLRNELASLQPELDQCFLRKDLDRVAKILVNIE